MSTLTPLLRWFRLALLCFVLLGTSAPVRAEPLLDTSSIVVSSAAAQNAESVPVETSANAPAPDTTELWLGSGAGAVPSLLGRLPQRLFLLNQALLL